MRGGNHVAFRHFTQFPTGNQVGNRAILLECADNNLANQLGKERLFGRRLEDIGDEERFSGEEPPPASPKHPMPPKAA